MLGKLLILFIFIVIIFLNIYNVSNIDNIYNDKLIKIEIKGNVLNPGVYEFTKDTIIKDALSVVDIKEDSDLSSLNLARKIHNGMCIVIPKKQIKQKISINTASKEELMTLPGIGESYALRIIEYRELHSFSKIEDIMNIKGIGIKSYEKIKELICL